MKTSKKRILAFVCAVCALAACLSLTACSTRVFHGAKSPPHFSLAAVSDR